jgi:hypothetical protein
MYSLDEAQKGIGGKAPNPKEIQKIEAQIIKSKQHLEKSEIKYHKACYSVELARQEWQCEMTNGCNQMQTIESDRINSLEQLINKLTIQISLLASKLTKIVDVYKNLQVDIDTDIQLACHKYGTSRSNDQEIFLYDIYAENTKNMMNRERRISNLTKWTDLLYADVQAQVKSRQGLLKVKNFARDNPNFANNDADVQLKIESVNFLQILFESSLYKIRAASSDLFENANAPTYQYSNLITTTYDKQVHSYVIYYYSI